MSKLIAFRLPDDLQAPLEARCKEGGLTVTAVILAGLRSELVRLNPAVEIKGAYFNEPPKPAQPKPFKSRLKGEWKAP